jgi:hypothetical protein
MTRSDFAVLVVGALVVGASLSACSTDGSLGLPCTLQRSEALPDGGVRRVALTEAELEPGTDVFDFQAAECDEFLCIRSGAVAPGGSPDAPAMGVCSRACGGAAAPCGSSGQLSCQPVVISPPAREAICGAYGADCPVYDGAHFCQP